MTIDEKEYLKSLEEAKQTKDDVVGRSFNNGLNYAIQLMKLYQEAYYKYNTGD